MGTINDLIRKLERFGDELQKLEKATVSIIPDAKGMIDRKCPRKECSSYFKVNLEDWKNVMRNEEVFCPICRNNSEAKEYLPIEQKQAVVSSIRRSIMDNWHYDKSISNGIASLQSTTEYEVQLQCSNCAVRYSVVGACYFCPNCGINSIDKTAEDSLKKITLQAKQINTIQDALELNFSKDEATIIVKSIIENALADCISTLQVYSEKKYNELSPKEAPFNAFQNVERSNKLWIDLKNEGYETWLSFEEQSQLVVFTQKRHLLKHKGGFVDDRYLLITNDKNYAIGDRILVNATEVLDASRIIFNIIENIKRLR